MVDNIAKQKSKLIDDADDLLGRVMGHFNRGTAIDPDKDKVLRADLWKWREEYEVLRREAVRSADSNEQLQFKVCFAPGRVGQEKCKSQCAECQDAERNCKCGAAWSAPHTMEQRQKCPYHGPTAYRP